MSRRSKTIVLLILLSALLLPIHLGAQSADKADAYYERAYGFYEQQRYEEAIELLERSAEIDRQLGKDRRSDLAYDHQLLGLCYLQTNIFDRAESSLLQARGLFSALGQRAEEVQALNHLGLVYYYWGAYPQAVDSFETALELAERFSVQQLISQVLNNLGLVYYAWGRYQEALEAYQQARRQNLATGQDYYAATNLGNIAGVYLAWGRYPEAVDSYRQALEYFRSRGDRTSTTNTTINLGLVYYAWGRYGEALELFEQGLQQAQEQVNPASQASALSSMGGALYATGRYDEALTAYRQALELFQRFGMTLNVLAATGSIGMVYQSWGRYDQALEYYRQALDLAENIGARDQLLTNLRSIASIYQGRREYQRAIEYYQRSLELARQLGRPSDVAINLDGLGTVYFEWRKFDKALEYYQQALDEAQAIGKRDEISRNLIHIAGVYQVRGETDRALETYEKALGMTRETGARADEATVLNNIGTLYLNRGEYTRAAEYFGKAIAVKEQLRDTAEGEIRRDFLASWISSYRWLIATYLFDDQAAAVFEAGELIKARYLSEQIGERSGTDGASAKIGFPGIEQVQRTLSGSEAVLSYANVDWEHPLVAYADRRELDLFGIEFEGFVSRNYREHRSTILKADNRTRGFTMVEIEESEDETGDPAARFAEIIRTYRWLLSQPALSASERQARDSLGRELYGLLIGPLERQLEDKEELILVPDGILAFIPLEALIMPDGRYLVERFHLRYLPSLTVSSQIARRDYGSRPKPLLAFGGAVYEIPAGQEVRQPQANSAPIVSAQALKALAAQTRQTIQGRLNTRDAYTTLGIGTWQQLPGTLTEVREIGGIVAGSTVVTGREVSEARIKQMSARGDLEQYRILHFATHGLVVPPVPELSALVLSQSPSPQADQEDGYLTMAEIAGLRIQADFVNLSACETGLGKIYGGEGVVGLSQAFLVAGANGLSVSLWQVADESTRTFMVGLYRLAQKQGLTHQRAMTEMKRRFIADPALKEPFYWAPFVYYGR